LVSVGFRVVVGALPETDVPAVCGAPERTEPQGAPPGEFITLGRSAGGLCWTVVAGWVATVAQELPLVTQEASQQNTQSVCCIL